MNRSSGALALTGTGPRSSLGVTCMNSPPSILLGPVPNPGHGLGAEPGARNGSPRLAVQGLDRGGSGSPERPKSCTTRAIDVCPWRTAADDVDVLVGIPADTQWNRMRGALGERLGGGAEGSADV